MGLEMGATAAPSPHTALHWSSRYPRLTRGKPLLKLSLNFLLIERVNRIFAKLVAIKYKLSPLIKNTHYFATRYRHKVSTNVPNIKL